jgi:hypothetical protein
MKALFPLLLLILLSCSVTGKGFHLTKIDKTGIEIAEIKKGLYDTIAVQLNEQQISRFVRIINLDSPAEMRKAFPQYWVFVKFKNDSVASYKILDHYIGERDMYVKTNEATYFKGLYENSQKTKPLISIK